MHTDVPPSQSTYWRERGEPQAATLRNLATRWHERQQGSAAIPSTHLDQLQDNAELLPWIILVAIDQVANDFRPYDLRSRFVGDLVAQYFSIEQGHGMLSELGSPFAERWFHVVDRIIETRMPASFVGSPHLTGFDFTHFELLVLPYASDGTAIDAALAGFAMSFRQHQG